jgi:hypothetical protein
LVNGDEGTSIREGEAALLVPGSFFRGYKLVTVARTACTTVPRVFEISAKSSMTLISTEHPGTTLQTCKKMEALLA